MTIGRKLYIGFGSILGILVLLFLISFTASQREHSARNTGAFSLQTIQTIEKIRFQVMENGLDLRNYLLSGDPRQEAAEANGIRTLASLMREAQNKTSDDRVREAYSVIESNQRSWEDDFSKPLIEKRHQVDAGQTTVSDLQIVYLQRSTNDWVERSVKEMDDAERSIQNARRVEQFRHHRRDLQFPGSYDGHDSWGPHRHVRCLSNLVEHYSATRCVN